jgi:hypothetical protein
MNSSDYYVNNNLSIYNYINVPVISYINNWNDNLINNVTIVSYLSDNDESDDFIHIVKKQRKN